MEYSQNSAYSIRDEANTKVIREQSTRSRYYGIAVAVLWCTVFPWFCDFIRSFSSEQVWNTVALVSMIAGYVALSIATWHMTSFLREMLTIPFYGIGSLFAVLILFAIWSSYSWETRWHDTRIIWTSIGLVITAVVVLYFEFTYFLHRIRTKTQILPAEQQHHWPSSV